MKSGINNQSAKKQENDRIANPGDRQKEIYEINYPKIGKSFSQFYGRGVTANLNYLLFYQILYSRNFA